MIWGDEADRLLIRLWDEGGSLGVVAAEMQRAGFSVSRNAIAGRRHRLKLSTFNRKTKQPTKTINPRGVNIVHQKITKPSPPKPIREVDITQHNGVDYLDNNRGCKAILSNVPRRGQWKLQPVCGLPRDGGPYCRAHTKLYCTPTPARAHR